MTYVWISFFVFVTALLALDLGVFHRRLHAISIKEALWWVAFWGSLGLIFTVFVYFLYQGSIPGVDLGNTPLAGNGYKAALQYLTGFVIEKSLSMDNMFVIAVILSYFAVPAKYQHRVLYWGIVGALVMRLAMITAGAVLVAKFDWVLYVFGAFLIVTAVRMFFGTGEVDPQRNYLIRLAKRFLPVSHEPDEQHFTTKVDGKRMLTPLALALLSIESADVIFAVDSIPAIFAITTEPFIIFTSNVFAILGLRSLYFALAGMMDKFRYLKFSLSVLLALIGIKMLLQDLLHEIPNITAYTLSLVVLILAGGVVASLMFPKPPPELKEHYEPGKEDSSTAANKRNV